MLCSIYKSPKKEGTYLYIPKRDDFSQVPDTLKQMFGKPIFVMLVNLE
ncbi:ycgL domain protein [Vibrio cholerae]|nr:ycgL domain protein [Vibrio cholerae]